MRIEEIRQRLRALGAGPRHEAHVLRCWSQALPQDGGKRRLEHFLPQPLRQALPGLSEELAGLARLQSEHPAGDGSARLLVALATARRWKPYGCRATACASPPRSAAPWAASSA
jgi:23S rRNA (adenine2503-C2)-methyltransferase